MHYISENIVALALNLVKCPVSYLVFDNLARLFVLDQALNYRQRRVLKVRVLLSECAFYLLIDKLDGLLVRAVVLVPLSKVDNAFINHLS